MKMLKKWRCKFYTSKYENKVFSIKKPPTSIMACGWFFCYNIVVEFMNGSLIGGGAYDYFVGKPSQNMKGENFLTVFQALSLMIAFATLMILVINTSNKK